MREKRIIEGIPQGSSGIHLTCNGIVISREVRNIAHSYAAHHSESNDSDEQGVPCACSCLISAYYTKNTSHLIGIFSFEDIPSQLQTKTRRNTFTCTPPQVVD